MMTCWYVKDLSKLTGVTVQTLHHYDRIGLLKPSLRAVNGYRVYSEKDLVTLQQIIALKFFGFKLSHIKALREGNADVRNHFALQAQFLAEKAKTLQEASQILHGALSAYDHNQVLPWETIIKLIEVYHMTQNLEKTWAGRVLNPEQLKEYATFEADLKTRFTEKDQKNFEKSWDALIQKVSENLEKDPTSDFGQDLGKQCMDLVNTLYGPDFATLRTTIWEKGYKEGRMDPEHTLPQPVVAWIDKAVDAYYRGRISALLSQVGAQEDTILRQQWEALMVEMYGNDEPQKQALVDAALADDQVSEEARKWLGR